MNADNAHQTAYAGRGALNGLFIIPLQHLCCDGGQKKRQLDVDMSPPAFS